MRFIVTKEGAERLELDYARFTVVGPDGTRIPREFDGPSNREALLGGFPRGVIGWAKKQLKVSRVEELDVLDSRLLYYVLTLRMVDHTLLPMSRFDDLAMTDFELVKHEVTEYDQDGDCGECSMPLEHSVHITSDDGPDIPPTTVPAEQVTTGTETS